MKEKLTTKLVFEELAKNMNAEGITYIKIGASLLCFEDVSLDDPDSCRPNVYEVIDWDNNKYFYNDLYAAVLKFIAVQPK